MSENKTIEVRYFAQMAQEAGLGLEKLDGPHESAREWFEELNRKYRWSLPAELIRPAIDGEYAHWDSPVPDGATLAFIPPVSGG